MGLGGEIRVPNHKNKAEGEQTLKKKRKSVVIWRGPRSGGGPTKPEKFA